MTDAIPFSPIIDEAMEPLTARERELLAALRAVAAWFAKADPTGELGDAGADYLNDDGWEDAAAVAAQVRAAIAQSREALPNTLAE